METYEARQARIARNRRTVVPADEFWPGITGAAQGADVQRVRDEQARLKDSRLTGAGRQG